MKEEEKIAAENLKGDRALFGSLLTHVVRASPDEDCASLILKTVGRAVEADRCYAYRFWEPGKSSMCTNTHEWCADGIEPMISGQQTCDLSELEEFNACITSGRDYIAIRTPLNAIIGSSDLPRRVLVVDDSPVNRAVLKVMLKKVGITDLELAVDGSAALDVLKRDQSFDLVLSDMWMPVMDGAELIRRIRGEERLAHLKVCSITADVESLATYREQGFDALLLKPVTVEKLAELLKNPDLRRPA
ncbi:MAG: response regulator [Kiritimatiellae bacterium]|nr:response regulator [Kiritimatiellia bacterium]